MAAVLNSYPTERPILFSGDMVRAILDGRKTQTRRVVKPMRSQEWLSDGTLLKSPRAKPVMIKNEQWAQFAHPNAGLFVDGVQHDEWSPLTCIKCPFGKVGDRLWVRENFRPVAQGSIIGEAPGTIRYGWYYEADKTTIWNKHTTQVSVIGNKGIIDTGRIDKIKPSIHMPRRASRTSLEITNIRVERVQDISEAGALAEGVNYLVCPQCGCGTYISHGASLKSRCSSAGCGLDYLSAVEEFRELWNSCTTKPEYLWPANPWVWVLEFSVIGKP